MSNTMELDETEATTDQTKTILATAHCRFCRAPLRHTFVDLGMSPLCESFLTVDQLNTMEPFYPLHVKVCDECFLVQLDQYVSKEHIFTEYAYFSSYSDSWLKHASNYVDMISKRLDLGAKSLAVELASNDGYLLQYFVKKGIPVLGVEPAVNVAKCAEEKGVTTLVQVFRLPNRAGNGWEWPGGGSGGRKQRAGAGSRSQRFCRRYPDCAQTGGSCHTGVPSSKSADGREPIRHDLP